jgi:maltose alpha-D-glucosyltransferase/alpha-amylase
VDRNGGFSRADPNKLYLPVNAGWVYGYQAVNVERQIDQPDSLLQWTRRMLEIRKRYRALAQGTYEELPGSNPSVLSFLREDVDNEGNTETVLCVHNLSRHPQPVQLNLSRKFHNNVPVELSGGTAFPNVGLRPYLLTLSGYGSYWFSLVPARQTVSRGRRGKSSGDAVPALHHSLTEPSPVQFGAIERTS